MVLKHAPTQSCLLGVSAQAVDQFNWVSISERLLELSMLGLAYNARQGERLKELDGKDLVLC